MTYLYLFKDIFESHLDTDILINNLNDIQRMRISSISNLKIKQRKAIASILLKRLLQCHVNVKDGDISIEYTKYGKPFLSNIDSTFFNYSYSSDYILIGISTDNHIGVDIEINTSVAQILADKVLSADEKSIYSSGNAKLKQRIFLEFWTRKESYLKYLGIGITHKLNTVNTCVENLHFLTESNDNYVFSVYPKPYDYKLQIYSLRKGISNSEALDLC